MRHHAEQRPHLAEQPIDDEADIQQQQRIVEAGQTHRRPRCGRFPRAINRKDMRMAKT